MHHIDKNSLKNWILAQKFQNQSSARQYHEVFKPCSKNFFEMKTASTSYLPRTKQRSSGRLCNPETALKHLKKDGKPMPIHANAVSSANGKVFIATQAPLGENPRKLHDDTMEDFWHMCLHEGVENIVMLCQFEEEGAKRCAHYFPMTLNESLKCGRYQLKTVACENFLNDIDLRKIEVEDISNQFQKTVITHYHYTGWPDATCPKNGDFESTYRLMKKVEKSLKPTVVHCSAGIGRTMSFIGIHVIAENVKSHGQEVTMTAEIVKLKNIRWHCLQTYRQTYWLQMAVIFKLIRDFQLFDLVEEFNEMNAMFHEVVVNEDSRLN